MKRWHILIITGVLVLGGILALAGPARNPADFAGKWYYAADGTPYLFHNGIIISEKYHLSEDNDEIFSGAYSFAKDRILLFIINSDGVEQIRELYLASQTGGDILCERTDEGVTAIFYRNKVAAKEDNVN